MELLNRYFYIEIIFIYVGFFKNNFIIFIIQKTTICERYALCTEDGRIT